MAQTTYGGGNYGEGTYGTETQTNTSTGTGSNNSSQLINTGTPIFYGTVLGLSLVIAAVITMVMTRRKK